MNAVEMPVEVLEPVLPPFMAKTRDFLMAELALQKDRLFLWFPVIFSIGIGFYFSLPAEPPLALGLMLFLFSLAALMLAPRPQRIMFLCIVMVSGGFAAGGIHTKLVYTPILKRDIKVTSIEGRIETIEAMEDGIGSKIVLNHVVIEKVPPLQTPVKVRMSVRKDEGLVVGSRVRILGGIGPPSPPLAPGGFDFQRYMYFQQIGGMGFAFKPAEILAPPTGWDDWIERTRVAIDTRIKAAMPFPEAAIAMALITGRRAGISQELNDNISAAGLAHLLSISGLHIGLAAGIIFFVTRLLMVCVPGFALRFPVKKYAALFAFAAAFFYTMLAGAPIPAQRSLLMVGIALLAIVLDRSPFSIRLVAFAGLAVLVFAPDSLITASFQMSFAAVAGLVIVFDYLRPWMAELYRNAGPVKKTALYFMSLGLTTVIATVFTAPFTVFHFQQIALYGVIANAVAVPLSGFVIMPAAVLSMVAMPLGLDHWPLEVVRWGVMAIIDVSNWTASLPRALIKFAAPPASVLPLFTGGVILVLLIRGPLKWIGVAPIIVGIVLCFVYTQPDILIDPEFTLVSYRALDGSMHVSNMRAGKFIREKWESGYGLAEGSAQAWPKEGHDGDIFCDEMACRLELKGRHVAILKKPEAMNEECGWANLILSIQPAGHQGCPGVPVIDKIHALRNGSYGIWLEKSGIRIETGQESRGRRPWSE